MFQKLTFPFGMLNLIISRDFPFIFLQSQRQLLKLFCVPVIKVFDEQINILYYKLYQHNQNEILKMNCKLPAVQRLVSQLATYE